MSASSLPHINWILVSLFKVWLCNNTDYTKTYSQNLSISPKPEAMDLSWEAVYFPLLVGREVLTQTEEFKSLVPK